MKTEDVAEADRCVFTQHHPWSLMALLTCCLLIDACAILGADLSSVTGVSASDSYRNGADNLAKLQYITSSGPFATAVDPWSQDFPSTTQLVCVTNLGRILLCSTKHILACVAMCKGGTDT